MLLAQHHDGNDKMSRFNDHPFEKKWYFTGIKSTVTTRYKKVCKAICNYFIAFETVTVFQYGYLESKNLAKKLVSLKKYAL